MPGEYSEPEFIKWRDKVHDLEVDVAVLKQAKSDSDRALIIAKESLDYSQAASNEWRKENIDQRNLFPNKSEVEGRLSTEAAERRALEQRIFAIEKASSAGEGKHSANVYAVGIALIFVQVFLAILFHFWK